MISYRNLRTSDCSRTNRDRAVNHRRQNDFHDEKMTGTSGSLRDGDFSNDGAHATVHQDNAASSLEPDKDVGLGYWNSVECNVDGMLGGVPTVDGFSVVSKIDLQSSRNFLAKLGIGAKPGLRIVDRALEGGAG